MTKIVNCGAYIFILRRNAYIIEIGWMILSGGAMGKSNENLVLIKNRTYKKSNELINSKGRGTLLSQKLFAIGMQHLTVDSTNNVVATIDSAELKALFGTTSGSMYSHIEEACDRSRASKGQTIFDWNILEKDPEKDHLIARQVVTDAEFKDGTLTLRYNNSLTDLIIDLKSNYTTLKLSETMSMKSVHSLRLFEILKSAYDKECALSKESGKHGFYYPLIELKLQLGIVTVNGDKNVQKELAKEYPDYDLVEEIIVKNGDNKYADFKDFNKVVIKKAVTEINDKTDMHIEYEKKKKGKNVVGIWFFVDRKANTEEEKIELTQSQKDEALDSLYEVMHSSLKLSEVRDLCNMTDYNKDKILDAYEYMMQYNSTVDVPVAFMKAAIQNGYKKPEKKTKKSKNSFNNFKQNEYDFEALEKALVEN